MKNLMILSLSLLMSCTYYRAVSKGTGNYTGKQVEGCTTHVLSIPFFANEERLDNVMNKYLLNHEDIYTVEQAYYNYFFWLVAQSCTVVTLNEKGQDKEPKVMLKKEKINPNSRFKDIKSLKECNQFPAIERLDCRKEIFERR
jgi:hypothetical protein